MKIFKKLKANIRLCVQIVFTALTNGYVLGFAKGKIFQGASKQICVPGLTAIHVRALLPPALSVPCRRLLAAETLSFHFTLSVF